MAHSHSKFRWQFQQIKDLFLKAGLRWNEDAASRLAASFSFFAILSLAPLLVLAVTVAGAFISGAQDRLLHEAAGYIGPQGANLLKGMIANVHNTRASVIATVFSVVVTFFSASNLLFNLDDAINVIWRIKPEGSAVRIFIVSRLVAFFGVFVFGSLIVGLIVFGSWMSWLSTHADVGVVWPFLSNVLSLFAFVGVFATAFKMLPRGKMVWADVWLPAVVTAIGFVLIKLLLNEYFAIAGVAIAYGAAGALVVILLWLFYSSQVYFFGVELAYVWAHEYGSLSHESVVRTAGAQIAQIPVQSEA